MARIIKTYGKIARLHPFGFWPGFIIGLIYFSYIFWWLWSVYPLILSGTSGNNLSFLIILLPFIITVMAMSSFWGIFSYSLYIFYKKIPNFFLPLFSASSFVLIEYLRTWFFGILWVGKDSLLGPHWTLGNPAYLLADFGPISRSASYWGIYGVDFLLILIGCTLFLLTQHQIPKKLLFIEVISLVSLLIFFNRPVKKLESKESKITISVIQTVKPAEFFDDQEKLLADFSEKNKLLREASKISDIVIFPESTDFSKTISGFLDPISAKKYFAGLSPKSTLVIDSNRIEEPDGIKSKAIFIDSKEGFADYYDKKLLTPGGESLPYLAKLPLWVFEHTFRNNFISSKANFAKGIGDNVLKYQDKKIKVVVCSDIISPNISGGGNYDFIVNLQNLIVFNGSRLIERELVSAAKFRAIENGKYLIISSNFGHSYVINPQGSIKKKTASRGYQILTADIVPNNTRTWYNRLGDFPILLLSLAIFGLGFKRPYYVK